MDAKSQQKVFISYANDEEAIMTLAKFIEKLGLKPTVIDGQPSKGQTIIDKFEEQAEETGFAIVLLSPDDVGSSKATGKRKLRARQNIIFELGYLRGGLGSKRLCALYKEGVELPSYIRGVVYVPMDGAGEWKESIVREMKSVGLLIDENKV